MRTYSGKQIALACRVAVLCTLWVISIACTEADDGTAKTEDSGTAKTEDGGTAKIEEFGWAKPLDMAQADSRDEVWRRYDALFKLRTAAGQEWHGELFQFYYKLAWNLWWLGIPVLKSPSDMWMMQQVIAEVRPDYVIEAGTWFGGSALYYAHVLEGLGLPEAKVITIDVQDLTAAASDRWLWKKRVEFILGSSTDEAVTSKVAAQVAGKRVLVSLDSLHGKSHVLDELKAYGPLVSPGSYLIAEDTSLDALPGRKRPGPMEAVEEFLSSEGGAQFKQDHTREALVMTFHPGGWLQRAE